MERKQVSFPVTSDEHEAIKKVAEKERRTIKQLVLSMLDQLYPGWSEKGKKNGTDQNGEF